MKPLSKKEKLEMNEELAHRLQEELFEKFWSVLEKDKEFNKLPKKEYTKRVFLIAVNMTLDMMSGVSPGDVEDEELIGG